MSHPELTTGVLLHMIKGAVLKDPVLQIIGSKKIETNSSDKERHRLLLSDGKWQISHAMYTAKPNDALTAAGEIPEFTIIKMNRYLTSTISTSAKSGERNVLVILDTEVLKHGKEVGVKLGNPKPLPNDLSQLDKENSTTVNNSKPTESEPSAKRPNLSPIAPPAKKPMTALNSTLASSLNSSIMTDHVLPICSLSPYQNKWVIKARVTKKGPIKTWSNSKGEGKLFSFDILDASGEMRVTGFKEMVDKYYEFLQEDKVYYISKCQIKMANKRFSSINNDYEMTLTNESVIQDCNDDAGDMPNLKFNFTSIDKIAQADVEHLLDVIGVCKQIGDPQTILTKADRRELLKREIVLVDQSKASITMTLWGNDAEKFNELHQIIAVKGARINEFGGGRSISVPGGGSFRVNPDIQESFALRGWFDNGGKLEDGINVSARTGSGTMTTNWLSFREVQRQNLGTSEKGDYYQLVGTILLMRPENLVYEACSSESCNKKVIDMENGRYRCEKCNIEMNVFKYRLIGNMNICDWSGNQWMSIFNPDCELIVGATAAEVGEKAKSNPSYLQDLATETNFKRFVFKCRVKTETYNDDTRLRTVAVKVEPVNYKTYNAQLLSQIQLMVD